MGKLLSIVAELEQRLDEFVVCLRNGLDHNWFERGIVLDGFKKSQHLRVARFFARQWRRVGKDGGKLIEEFSGNTHCVSASPLASFGGSFLIWLQSLVFIVPPYSASGYINTCWSTDWIARLSSGVSS